MLINAIPRNSPPLLERDLGQILGSGGLSQSAPDNKGESPRIILKLCSGKCW